MAEFVEVSKKWNEVCGKMDDCEQCEIRGMCGSNNYSAVEELVLYAWDKLVDDRKTTNLVDQIDALENQNHNLQLYLDYVVSEYPMIAKQLEDKYDGMPGYVQKNGFIKL